MEVENHIFRHNWIFRHTYMYKTTHIGKVIELKFFEQILYSYFRYTGSLFLGCALFVARCNIIRASSDTKKERYSYSKKYIEEFVWEKSLFWLNTFLSMSFFYFFVYFLLLPKWRTCLMFPIKIHTIAMGGILCDDIMSQRLKIWKSLAI